MAKVYRTPLHPLVEAVVALNRQLDLPTVLAKVLEAATDTTGAKYAAINVLDADGISVDFHYRGMDARVWKSIGRAPNSVGVLAEIPDEGALVISELTEHAAFRGLPKGHPPMGAFLGVALRTRGQVFGYLYLASKEGGFSADDVAVISALAAAASVAIDNAQLYEEALERESWLAASQAITTALLANPGDEDAIARIVASARDLGNAAAAALVLPGLEDEWVMEFTDGEKADDMLGLILPDSGYAMQVIQSGQGAIAPLPPGPYLLPAVREFGPALYAPLRAQHRTVGLLMLWRHKGQPLFDEHDLATAQRFSNQAALALQFAELAHVRNVTALLEERERLADDLHDFVSQELFATAIQLEAIAEESPGRIKARLLSTMQHLKRAQHEVRGVMSSLQGQRTSEPLQERVGRELLMARDSLGFSAEIGQIDWAELDTLALVDPTLSDDVVAVIRELLSNVARHAQATWARVSITAVADQFEIEVCDNGVGPAGAKKRHSGTSNLANRAIRRDGSFELSFFDEEQENPGTRARWIVSLGSE